ncbi:MAG: hypothetical protein HYT86_00025 [candidate division NC10 bacterium]|nr:hypothetical protein [candidate division NC10 bacterium]
MNTHGEPRLVTSVRSWLRPFREQDWLAPHCLILLLAVVGYGFLLRPGELPYTPHSDIVPYHIGAKEVLFRSWHAGRGIPFWRADQLAGGPALTNPNGLYTYPLHFLFYLLSPPEAMGWTIWLHLVIGAWVYYALGQALGLGRLPRVLMATAALFNFKVLMAVYAGWLSFLPSITFFPLLFATVFRIAKRPGAGNALAVAAAGALTLHGGHIQLVYYSGWFLIAYLLITQVASWRAGQRQHVRQVATWLCWSALLAIGMAAYLLWPLAAEAPLISRGDASIEFLRRGHALEMRHLLTFFRPEALGSPLDGSYPGVEMWEDVAYFGLLPLLLALVGAVLGRRRSPTCFLAVGLATSLLVSLDTPVLRLLYELLPGFRLFRLPARLLFLTAFFGIALAGIGLEELLARLQRRRSGTWWPRLATAVIVLAIAAEGTAYAHKYLGMLEHSRVVPTTDYAQFLATDPTVFRTAPVGRGTVNYGSAAAMRLQLITGYEPFNLRHYQRYLQLMQWGRVVHEGASVMTDLLRIARGDLFDALNVKYLLATVPLRLPPDRFEPVARYPDQPVFAFYRGMELAEIFIYRNKKVLPRAFWVERVVLAQGEDEAIAEMQRHNLQNLAVVQGSGPEGMSSLRSQGDRATVVDAADGYLAVQTESQRNRFLVISEIWHPGWRARLDGREIPLHRTDLALMGAWIPAGKHHLMLEFRPLHWRTALTISMLSGAAFVTCLVAHVVWRRTLPGGVQ